MFIFKLIKCKIFLFYFDFKYIVNCGFMKFMGISFCEFYENYFFKNVWLMILLI